MTREQAEAIAKVAYGPRGFCRGGTVGYQIGYYRRGKPPRRNLLSTVHGRGETPQEALHDAVERCKGTMTGSKLSAALTSDKP